MKLLLDAHTLLWFISADSRLSQNARTAIEDAEAEKYVSVVSLWEIAIKISIGKMSLAAPFDVLFPHQLEINGFRLLPVEVSHASIVGTLPFRHRDPFDRLLIAQAMKEDMTLLSIDAVFDSYSVRRQW